MKALPVRDDLRPRAPVLRSALVALGVLCLLACPALAADAKRKAASLPGASTPSVAFHEGHLSIEAKAQTLRSLLAAISRAAGITFHVEETLPDAPVTISVKDVPVESALKRLLAREFDLMWAYEGPASPEMGESRVAEVWVLAKAGAGVAIEKAPKAPKKVEEPADNKERLEAIAKMGGSPAKDRKSLMGLLDDEDSEIRRAAAEALAEMDGARAIGPLARMLKTDADAEARQTAAEALGELESRAAIPALREALKDSEAEVRQSVIASLAKIGGAEAERTIRLALGDESEDVREAAADALSELNDDD